MIKVNCIVCTKELKEPGALFIGTPDKLGSCMKMHLCVKCEGYFSGVLMDAQKKELEESTKEKIVEKPKKNQLPLELKHCYMEIYRKEQHLTPLFNDIRNTTIDECQTYYDAEYDSKMDGILQHLKDLDASGDIQINSGMTWENMIKMHRSTD